MMGSNLPNPHPPGCFWHHYAEKFGVPDIKYCEETLCQFISEPANTWSNLAIVFVGIYIAFTLKKDPNRSRFLELYGVNTFFVGITSLFYHLSNNFLTQFIDFLGMYAFAGLFFLGNLELLGRIKKERVLQVYLISFIPFTAFFFGFRYFGIPVQLTIALILLGAFVTKYFIVKSYSFSLKWLLISVGFFLTALLCQIGDINRFNCNPKNHWFQLHACWHVFNALAMGSFFVYSSKLKKKG